MKARTLLVIFAAVVALVAAPAAKAACTGPHAFYGYDLNTSAVSYIFFPGMNTNFETNLTTPTGGLIGRLWQPAARTANNEGGLACPLASWLNTPTFTPDGYYVNGNLSGQNPAGIICDQVGCPSNAMIIVIEATSTDGKNAFVVASKAVEDPAAPAYFTYVNENNAWTLQPIPKPYVTNSTRAGSAVNVSMNLRNTDVTPDYQGTVGFPDIGGVITGMNIYRFQGAAEPGRARVAWGTAIANVAYTGADVPIAPQAADCSVPSVNTFYAASLVFDGGQFESDYVSAAVTVNCNPALADPGKYKKVDRKKK